MQTQSQQLLILIEDARAIGTWHTLIDIASQCACKTAKTIIEIRSARGPLEGLRLAKNIGALRKRYPYAIIVVAPDTDRYGGAEKAEERLANALKSCCRNIISSVEILPVLEKLEDWVFSLLKGQTCKCCGVEKLATVLGDKYEKYMMAKRVPNKLKSNRDKVCENFSKGWLLKSTGLEKLLDLLCIQR